MEDRKNGRKEDSFIDHLRHRATPFWKPCRTEMYEIAVKADIAGKNSNKATAI